jgi:hypothetical protein
MPGFARRNCSRNGSSQPHRLARWRWSGGYTPSFLLATLELGRIAERLKDTRKAAECYAFVIATWHRPDRELLPYVAEAREGLARLRVE